MLFLISGIGTLFSLNKRSVGRFLSERFVRLIIPLIFGMLVIVPPQVYFERLAQGVPYGNYFDFYPADVFTVPILREISVGITCGFFPIFLCFRRSWRSLKDRSTGFVISLRGARFSPAPR